MTASDYVTGTITLTNGEAAFTGTGTGWAAAGFREGDTIIDVTGATEYMGVVATIDGSGAGALTQPWEGPTLEDVAYRMRYQGDGSRVTAQARQLIEILGGSGNLEAFAALEGASNRLPVFLGPGAMGTVPLNALIVGFAADHRVPNMAARAAYDDAPAATSVLVDNTGDGRAAIYTKESADTADWSAPAYVTGPGISIDIGTVFETEFGTPPAVSRQAVTGGYLLHFGLPGGAQWLAGTVETVSPAEPASIDVEPVAGGFRLDMKIPAAEGFYPAGTYDPDLAYLKSRVVRNQGAAWLALQDVPIGEAPPTLPTAENDYWWLLVAPGADGMDGASLYVRVHAIDTHGGDPDEDYEAGKEIDGVPLAAGWLLSRATPGGDSLNGIYLVPASGAASRAAPWDVDYNSLPGTGIWVVLGEEHGGTEWRVSSTFGGVLDTDPVEIEEHRGGAGAEMVPGTVSISALDDGELHLTPDMGRYLTLVDHGTADYVIESFGDACPVGWEVTLFIPRTIADTGEAPNQLGNYLQFIHSLSGPGFDNDKIATQIEGTIYRGYRAYPDATDGAGNRFALHEELSFIHLGDGRWKLVGQPEDATLLTGLGYVTRRARGAQHLFMRTLETRSASGTLQTAVTFPAAFVDREFGNHPYLITASINGNNPTLFGPALYQGLTVTGLNIWINRTNTANTNFCVNVDGYWKPVV